MQKSSIVEKLTLISCYEYQVQPLYYQSSPHSACLSLSLLSISNPMVSSLTKASCPSVFDLLSRKRTSTWYGPIRLCEQAHKSTNAQSPSCPEGMDKMISAGQAS